MRHLRKNKNGFFLIEINVKWIKDYGKFKNPALKMNAPMLYQTFKLLMKVINIKYQFNIL